MKERPILFSGPMVRAIMEGRKTQTRRVVKDPPIRKDFDVYHRPDGRFIWISGPVGIGCGMSEPFYSPYGVPGDRLWVREAWRPFSEHDTGAVGIEYRAGGFAEFDLKAMQRLSGKTDQWRPSIHMPRWASRITLEITEVRVQRLQEIGADDCIAEGVETAEMKRNREGDFSPGVMGWMNYGPPRSYNFSTPQESFRSLWDSINATRGFAWNTNPWVWCISFRRLP